MRKEFETNGQAPSLRKLKNESGVGTKELYQLFPKGPAKKAALIAGLGKPQGCI
jgi:tRNA 2-thiouridine synthesizing protein E